LIKLDERQRNIVKAMLCGGIMLIGMIALTTLFIFPLILAERQMIIQECIQRAIDEFGSAEACNISIHDGFPITILLAIPPVFTFLWSFKAFEKKRFTTWRSY
jgi:hypothetical protein